jgi:polyisoprenoid-binding protein YceI
MKKLNALFITLLVTGSVFAQTTWNIDKSHSKIGFSVVHMAVTDVEGNFKDFDGSVVSKTDDFNGAEVSFSAKTASIDTDNEKRDGHLQSPDFFDAAKYPETTFKGVLAKVDGKKYQLKGDLTMHGVTKPATFDVIYGGTINSGWGIKAGFKLNGTINRKDFGLTWDKTVPTGELVVSDEVQIIAKIEVDKKVAETAEKK